jgi:CubicO group peptidase (beta-lactamase class C family)
VLAKGYGKAKSDAATPVTADTPMALGSVSKQFLCAVIYGLADVGKLALTDPAAKWYPRATRAADITLADLGGHTAGYRDYYPLDYVDARMLKPIEPDALIADYAQLPLDFEPRTRWSYSNTGFIMLARIAEQVTGKPYATLLDERIFKPLGMSASLAPGPNAATGHVSFLLDGAKPGPFEARGWLFGIGDIWASANDLVKWDLAMMDGKVVSPTSHQALATPRALANGRSTGYSCGWSIRPWNGEQVMQHAGWVGGFHTRNAIVPRTRSAVILLTNDEYTHVENDKGRVGRVRGTLYLDVGREGGIVRLGRAVTDLSIVSTAGGVHVRGLRCFTSIKAMGGDVALADQRGRFAVHCAGGEVFVEPAATLLGQSRVDVVGGECTIALLSTMSARVRATAFGGEVNLAPAFRLKARKHGAATLVEVGARDDGPDIEVRVAGAQANIVQTEPVARPSPLKDFG